MLRLPTHVQLEITDICNLRCKHCYRFDTSSMPKSNDLEDEDVMLLVQKMVDAKIYSLVITGGEPLARPNLAVNAVKAAKNAGMFVSINTNLLLLTPELALDFKESGIDSFLVSCPASDPDVYRHITRCGDYNRLREKIKLLSEVGISCMINMVVTPVNREFIKTTASDMRDLGVKRFAATPAGLNVEHPNLEELLSGHQTISLLDDLRWCADNLKLEVDILEPLPKCFLPSWCWEKDYSFTKRSCQAGRMSVSISNVGDVRPCSHNPNVYGNIFHETLSGIWGKMVSYRNDVVPDICKCCSTVSSCNGACRTNSLASFGLLNKQDRLTIGPISLPPKREVKTDINDYSVVHFNGKLRWRREDKNYSISSKNGGGNLIVVNEEMFHFVCWLAESSPLSVSELLKNGAENSTREAFIKIIGLLIRKEFAYLINP